MTGFITHCWRKVRLDAAVLLVCACLTGVWPVVASAESPLTEVTQLRLERSGDGIVLSSTVKFDLPQAVEEALLKGVPLFFVAEAEVFRERWYWTDQRVAGAARHMRLMFYPLTRRWRLGIGSGPVAATNSEAVLSRNFDSLEDAMAAVRRVTGWHIASVSDITPDARHRVEFRFRLDVSQLPRPLQIGVLGQADWYIAMFATQKLVLENLQ